MSELAPFEVKLPKFKRGKKEKYAWRKDLRWRVKAKVDKVDRATWRRQEVEVIVLINLRDTAKDKKNGADNILKDILDALQGRAGGGKNKRMKHRLIDNDTQVRRVLIEKQFAYTDHDPDKGPDDNGGAVLVRPYSERSWKQLCR